MATQDPKTDPQVEEKRRKGPSLLSNITQMIILLEFGGHFLRIFRKFN